MDVVWLLSVVACIFVFATDFDATVSLVMLLRIYRVLLLHFCHGHSL